MLIYSHGGLNAAPKESLFRTYPHVAWYRLMIPEASARRFLGSDCGMAATPRAGPRWPQSPCVSAWPIQGRPCQCYRCRELTTTALTGV